MSDARTEVLARVRNALGDVPVGEAAVPERVERAGVVALDMEALVERFAERVEDYRATVTRCEAGDDQIALAVAAATARHGARRLAVAPGVAGGWRPDGVTFSIDEPALSITELDAVDGVLTGSALGIAETGTIVLDGGPSSGRRALTLVPDLHICVVRAADLVAGVPEAMLALRDAFAAGRPLTFVSGPSATSDIELDRVEGVHGPRRLEVVLAT
ncbi:MAG TPA: LUD domain-containing protein [Baekduia sp.]